MKKNVFTKIVAVFMAVMMIVPFAACDNGNNGDTIKIAGIGPVTGPYGNYGTSVMRGAKLAVDEINNAGGICGKQIEFRFEDSQGDPASAVNAYGLLIDWGMDVSLAAVFSGETASVVADANQDDILLLTPSGSADNAIEGNNKAFRVCFADSFQGTAAADYIYNNKLATEVAVFYESDIDYSAGLYKAFKTRCAELGITIVETQSFTADTNTDFSTQRDALIRSGAKVIFIPIYAEEASTFLSQSEGKFADDVYFFGADGLDGIIGKVADNVNLADNVLMLTPFAADSKDERVAAFVKNYKAAYKTNDDPDQFAADGYDAIYIIKAAIEEANGETSGKTLASIMTKLKHAGITGTMTWGADGNTNKDAQAIVYKNGVGSLFSK